MVAIAQLGYFIAAHNWAISCAAHNWVILSSWVRVSHGGTTGLFHSSTQLGYFMQLTAGLFVSRAQQDNWVIFHAHDTVSRTTLQGQPLTPTSTGPPSHSPIPPTRLDSPHNTDPVKHPLLSPPLHLSLSLS